jgi:hypothetical protein
VNAAGFPRIWWTIGVPGIVGRPSETYWPVELDAMPAVPTGLMGDLDWLVSAPRHGHSLERSANDYPARDADAAGLAVVAPDLALPATFRRFVVDPEPRRHMRSATACYLDLADFAVRLTDGSSLVHFLSDQQSVLHWLLFVGRNGEEAVLASPNELGYALEGDDESRSLDIQAAREMLAVCSDSFEEFLYRYWLEHELFHRLAVDKTTVDQLPSEMRAYALAYPRSRAYRS